MIVRRFIGPVMAAILVAGACGGDPPPPPPPPPGPDMESLRAYQDSVRRAQEAAAAEAARRQAEAAAEAERQRRVAAARATLEEMVFFDFDMSQIRPDAEAVLRRKAEVLRASPQVRLRIEGLADERGSTEYNLALGNRRAESVRQFLTGFGISADRFEIVSFGEDRPLAQGSNEQAWARNRRGQFVIIAGQNAINPPA